MIETEAQVMQKIKELDSDLDRFGARRKLKNRVNAILVGGAGLIVKYALERATDDIDVVPPLKAAGMFGSVGSLMANHGLHVVNETIMLLHPDYEERIQPLWESANLCVFILDARDYAISKIGRGLEKDIADVLRSNLLDDIQLPKLEELYFEAMSYWIGDERRFRGNWEAFMRRFEKEILKTNKISHGNSR